MAPLAPSSLRNRSRPAMLLAPALIVLAAVLLYANALRAPFVYDDRGSILDNPSIRQLTPVSGVLMPGVSSGATVAGRPLLNVSLALNHAVSGTAPWSYHLFNVLVHASCGLALFGLVRRTLSLARDPERPETRIGDRTTALLIALVWVAHPLNTQAVTYTIQRAESLMGLFYLLTLYAFVRSLGAPRSTPWLGISAFFCLCGMATKEVMATAPLAVLLYDRCFVAGSFAAALRERLRYYVALAATWLLLLALVVSTGGNRGGTVGLGTGVTWWAYPATQAEAIVRYLALSVWPYPLVFDYGTHWVSGPVEVLPYALIVAVVLGLTAFALRRAPRLGFLGAWFFVILAPTSLTPGTIQMIVEHRMYLPLIAVVTAVVLAARSCLGRAVCAGLIAATLALGLVTVARNRAYASPLALWSDTLAKRPANPTAHIGVAEALEDAGQVADAVTLRQRAVMLDPADARARFNLGNALARLGRLDEAIAEFAESLRLDPTKPNVHLNFAHALAARGRNEEALEHYSAATRLAPQSAHAYFSLGVHQLRLGRASDAVSAFETAARLDPRDAATEMNWGTALVQSRQIEQAIPHFEAALRLNPTDADARRALVRAHGEVALECLDRGRLADAITHYVAALELEPTHAVYHHNLGIAYARLSRWADAEREFQAAVTLKPDYAEARQHLQQARAAAQGVR